MVSVGAVGAAVRRGAGLCIAGGDEVAVRTFADSLLALVAGPGERRAACLLMTAICLHLDSANGPEPEIADVARILHAATRALSALNFLADSPMQLLRYVWAELESLDPAEFSATLSLCLQSVREAQL
jgi:hypothetical protein